jgi:DNA-binding CsgD family transcriptional regulator
MSAYLYGDLGPMHRVRDLAARNGALVSVAAMDLALAEFGLGTYDRQLCLTSAQRCVESSGRYHLASLPVAYLWLAGGHALAGDREAMEAAAAKALEPDPDDPRILGDLWGRVRATYAIVRDDHDQLRHDLERMMEQVRVAPVTTSIFPTRILWGLLHAIDDDDLGAAAVAELESATHLRAWPIFSSALGMMRAIALGRQGRADEAAAAYAAALALRHAKADHDVLYCNVLVAGAAIRDGWGDPVAWLRTAEAFFATRGYDGVVRRCRTLLAAAGAPVPRKGRGDSEVPEELRALGITSRELDVLKLVAQGLSNREISERLVLSPKTVERHLSSLFDRTGRRTRGALAELLR